MSLKVEGDMTTFIILHTTVYSEGNKETYQVIKISTFDKNHHVLKAERTNGQ